MKKVNYKAILEVMSIKRNYSPQEMLRIHQAVDKYVLSRQPEILNELFDRMLSVDYHWVGCVSMFGNGDKGEHIEVNPLVFKSGKILMGKEKTRS